MLKKFSLWLEEREKTRRIKDQIYDRLHFSKDIDPSTVKIKGLKLLPQAIDELGIEDENTLDMLKNWVRDNEGATLTQFLMQINPDDVPDREDVPGDPAQLPPEQDQQQQGQPQDQQQMPPDQGPMPDPGAPPPPAKRKTPNYDLTNFS